MENLFGVAFLVKENLAQVSIDDSGTVLVRACSSCCASLLTILALLGGFDKRETMKAREEAGTRIASIQRQELRIFVEDAAMLSDAEQCVVQDDVSGFPSVVLQIREGATAGAE